jgi:hypothetical protein
MPLASCPLPLPKNELKPLASVLVITHIFLKQSDRPKIEFYNPDSSVLILNKISLMRITIKAQDQLYVRISREMGNDKASDMGM